jgi:hypothetical protein
MLNYDLLTKAINKVGKAKPQVKPKVDAAAFIDEVSSNYNTIDKYFIADPTSLLDSGAAMFDSLALAELDYPISVTEMIEVL